MPGPNTEEEVDGMKSKPIMDLLEDPDFTGDYDVIAYDLARHGKSGETVTRQ